MYDDLLPLEVVVINLLKAGYNAFDSEALTGALPADISTVSSILKDLNIRGYLEFRLTSKVTTV
jgi:hypothetical protein